MINILLEHGTYLRMRRTFRKPCNPLASTQHLWLANCGGLTPITMEHLRQTLSEARAPLWTEAFFPQGHTAVANLSYDNLEDAKTVKELIENKLSGSEEFYGRKVKVEFSELVENDEEKLDLMKKNTLGLMNVDVRVETKVPGLYVLLNAVSVEEEMILLEKIYQIPWDTNIKRRVQHYGFEFDYEIRNVHPDRPIRKIPEFLKGVLNKLQVEFGQVPDQVTINEYKSGEGISPHVDTHSAFEDGISILSLGSLAVMSFSDLDSGSKRDVVLPRRSLCIMTKESRYSWTHHIPQRKHDLVSGKLMKRETRVSLTFRNIRGKPCQCDFPKHCDVRSQISTPPNDQHYIRVNPKKSQQNDFVTQFYDSIADHFSRTRYKPWPKVEKFITELRSASVVGDIGCGNGKYLGLRNDITMVGMDISLNLLKICKVERGFEVLKADILNVPFRDHLFDALLCIAVFHHLDSQENRISALKELSRLVKPGGKILLYAWAFEQDKDSKRSFVDQDIYVPWDLQSFLPEDQDLETKMHQMDEKLNVDRLIDGVRFKLDTTTFRYCHLYREGELEQLIQEIPQLEVTNSYMDCGNWCVEILVIKMDIQ